MVPPLNLYYTITIAAAILDFMIKSSSNVMHDKNNSENLPGAAILKSN